MILFDTATPDFLLLFHSYSIIIRRLITRAMSEYMTESDRKTLSRPIRISYVYCQKMASEYG